MSFYRDVSGQDSLVHDFVSYFICLIVGLLWPAAKPPQPLAASPLLWDEEKVER